MAVVDASVVIEFVAPDADPAAPVHALFDQWAQKGEKLHALLLLPLEVMNALITGYVEEGGTVTPLILRAVSLGRCRSACTMMTTTGIEHGSCLVGMTTIRSTTCCTWHWLNASARR